MEVIWHDHAPLLPRRCTQDLTVISPCSTNFGWVNSLVTDDSYLIVVNVHELWPIFKLSICVSRIPMIAVVLKLKWTGSLHGNVAEMPPLLHQYLKWHRMTSCIRNFNYSRTTKVIFNSFMQALNIVSWYAKPAVIVDNSKIHLGFVEDFPEKKT